MFTSAKRANQGDILGFKFRLQSRYVYITEIDINIALHLPVDNFDAYPSNEELLELFSMAAVHT